MRITPRNALITVRFLEPRRDTKIGRIHIPTTHGAQFKMAVIVEVGRGTPEYNTLVGTDDLSPGQTVLVKAGQQVDIGQSVQSYLEITDQDGNDLALLNQHDIVAIVNDTADDNEVVSVGNNVVDDQEGDANGAD